MHPTQWSPWRASHAAGPGAPTMGMRSHPQSVLHLGWHGNIVGHWGGAGGSRGLWLPVFAQMLCRSRGLQGHPV